MTSLATDRQYRLRNSLAPTSTVRSGIDPEEDAWGPSDDEKGKRLLGKDLAKSLSVMPSVATYITRSWSANEVSSWKVPQCIVSKWESTAMPPLTHVNVTSIEPKDATIHESRDRQSEFLRTCHERSDRDLTVLQTPSVAHVAVFGALEDGPAWYIESSHGRDSRRIVQDGILKIYTTSVFKFRHISPSQDLLKFDLEVIEAVARDDLVELSIEHPAICNDYSSRERGLVPTDVCQAIYTYLTHYDIAKLLQEKHELRIHQNRRRRMLAYALASCLIQKYCSPDGQRL